MLEFRVDGYEDIIRLEDDEEFPADFLKWINRDDEITECIRDEVRHELGKLRCEE